MSEKYTPEIGLGRPTYKMVRKNLLQFKLKILRARIDLLDRLLLKVLSQRMTVVKNIGFIKREFVGLEQRQSIRSGRRIRKADGNFSPSHFVDNARKHQVHELWSVFGKKFGLRIGFVHALYELVHSESVLIQSEKRK